MPLHLISSVLALAAAFLFWNARRTAPGTGSPERISGRLSEDVAAYVVSPKADAACKACLSAADDFLTERRTAMLREKTKGMVLIPAGNYTVGSPENIGNPDEHPQRQVYLDAFYMDEKETTVSEYMRFAQSSPGNHPEWAQPGGKFNIETGKDGYYKRLDGLLKTCGDCPVFGVSARNAEAYCASRNKRLPTEAEWEAAARGGKDSLYSFGNDTRAADDYAWYDDNAGRTPHPAGGKLPNAYGIYDMHGNVWEWTADKYDASYYSGSTARNPKGPASGRENVIRGGSWAFDMDSARAANRASSDKPNDDIGFRCAVSADAAENVVP